MLWTMSISLVVIGVIVTHENLWLIGAMIWLIFIIISQISFRQFRYTFDMVDTLDAQSNSATIKRSLLYIAFAIAYFLIILLAILRGILLQDFVLAVYGQAITISFGIVVVVFAAQTIIPSITAWGGAENQKRTPSNVREMKLLLRTSQGLIGFLQIFFIVFIISLLGWVLTSLVPQGSAVVNLSLSSLTTPTTSLTDLLNPTLHFQFSIKNTSMFLETLLFCTLVCTFSFSLSLLYYLFIATNLMVLPIKDALLSQPVLIQHMDAGPSNLDLKGQVEKVHNSLERTHALRGEVIPKLALTRSENDEIICTIILTQDFASTPEIISKTIALLGGVFHVAGIDEAIVIVNKSSLAENRWTELLSIQLTKGEYENFRDCSGTCYQFPLQARVDTF